MDSLLWSIDAILWSNGLQSSRMFGSCDFYCNGLVIVVAGLMALDDVGSWCHCDIGHDASLRELCNLFCSQHSKECYLVGAASPAIVIRPSQMSVLVVKSQLPIWFQEPVWVRNEVPISNCIPYADLNCCSFRLLQAERDGKLYFPVLELSCRSRIVIGVGLLAGFACAREPIWIPFQTYGRFEITAADLVSQWPVRFWVATLVTCQFAFTPAVLVNLLYLPCRAEAGTSYSSTYRALLPRTDDGFSKQTTISCIQINISKAITIYIIFAANTSQRIRGGKDIQSAQRPHELCNEPLQWSTIIQIFTNRVGMNSQATQHHPLQEQKSASKLQQTTFHQKEHQLSPFLVIR
ncbi:hypothetical protein Nepgr_015835 [Nepenthes gracilis]|uniref:Uncharacterized protein n=1 Tax=Nepenthes gracilis TaxID=150966 RepID=A0AAD3XRG9_NEPGR|nr:hypothetical protein Nepgr_015835 [Nepenthes gracilis]